MIGPISIFSVCAAIGLMFRSSVCAAIEPASISSVCTAAGLIFLFSACNVPRAVLFLPACAVMDPISIFSAYAVMACIFSSCIIPGPVSVLPACACWRTSVRFTAVPVLCICCMVSDRVSLFCIFSVCPIAFAAFFSIRTLCKRSSADIPGGASFQALITGLSSSFGETFFNEFPFISTFSTAPISLPSNKCSGRCGISCVGSETVCMTGICFSSPVIRLSI